MYNKQTHIHFAGIGGIGMSGIATILRHQGYVVSGCDLNTNQTSVQSLRELDCIVYQGNHTPHCITNTTDILVYSSAIANNHPEVQAARARGIPAIPRALMLAELMRTKYSIAIAGSHGKTTTTSLVSHILIEAGLDPTVIVGGYLQNISHNARIGESDLLVAEADESDRSIIHLKATFGLITNIDFEHVETYRNLLDIQNTFSTFLDNLPFYGRAIICADDPNTQTLLPLEHTPVTLYGCRPHADIRATAIKLMSSSSEFTVHKHNKELGRVHSNLPGHHNVLNTLGALALTDALEVPFDTATRALATFTGVDRRFSYRGTYREAEIFDDYGHHPREITCTLTVARARTHGRLVVAFQPHRYSRTALLWNAFIDAFLKTPPDYLIVTDIYAASETPINETITAQNFVDELKKTNPPFSVCYLPAHDSFSTIKKYLDTVLEPQDLFLTLGAGRITHLSHQLVCPADQSTYAHTHKVNYQQN